jgi:hypothetical protein
VDALEAASGCPRAAHGLLGGNARKLLFLSWLTIQVKHAPSALLNLTVALAGTALIGAGCSKADRADATSTLKEAAHDTKVATQEVAHDAGVAITDAWEGVRNYAFDKRSDFSKQATAVGARMEAQVSALRTEQSEAQASESRGAAMDELRDSQADFNDKLAALGTATADTWDAARNNVILAWDRLDAKYQVARAN